MLNIAISLTNFMQMGQLYIQILLHKKCTEPFMPTQSPVFDCWQKDLPLGWMPGTSPLSGAWVPESHKGNNHRRVTVWNEVQGHDPVGSSTSIVIIISLVNVRFLSGNTYLRSVTLLSIPYSFLGFIVLSPMYFRMLRVKVATANLITPAAFLICEYGLGACANRNLNFATYVNCNRFDFFSKVNTSWLKSIIYCSSYQIKIGLTRLIYHSREKSTGRYLLY